MGHPSNGFTGRADFLQFVQVFFKEGIDGSHDGFLSKCREKYKWRVRFFKVSGADSQHDSQERSQNSHFSQKPREMGHPRCGLGFWVQNIRLAKWLRGKVKIPAQVSLDGAPRGHWYHDN